jgi:hypothetical protein
VQRGNWLVTLTLLRVPLARLWPEVEARPPLFDGSVVPEVYADSDAQAVATSVQVPFEKTAVVVPSPVIEEVAHREAPSPAQVFSPLPLPMEAETEADDGFAPAVETATDNLCQQSEFLAWLRAAIVTGRLKTNTADARVHYVEEGLLLVSPAVFRDFAGVTAWEAAQKKLLKLRLHRKTAQDTNVWTYRVVGETKSGALLRGIIIPEPQAQLGIVVTRINPVLHRVTDVGKAASNPAEVFPVETPERASP